MNNKNVIIGVVIAVIVILIGLFFGLRASAPGTLTPSSGAPVASPTAGPMTLKALLVAGPPQKCSFTDTTENANSSGTVLVASGKMRGDFTSVSQGKTIQSHMIVAENTSYVWTDDMAQGFKMPLAQVEAKTATGTQSPSGVDVNKALNYSCGPWLADDSVFTLPANVTFSDVSAMMQNIPQPSVAPAAGTSVVPNAAAKSAQCGACNSAPEPARSQCLAALGCQ